MVNLLIQLVELSEVEMEECPEWTPSRIHQAFRLTDANITAEQQEQVVKLLSQFPSILSSRDLDVGCTCVVKVTPAP